MMDLLNSLTIKNLKLNKKRTFVTIIGIMLSVALITAVATMYSSCIQSLINFETYQKGNFHVAFFDVPVNEVETIRNNRGVEELYLTSNVGYSKLEDSKNEYKPYIYVRGFTKQAIKELSLKLVEGRLPENENEIVIPTHLRTNGRVVLNVGETITLNVGTRMSGGYELTQDNKFSKDANEEIVNTTAKTYKIVGIIERPASNIESYSAPGYTFITYMDENNMKDKVNVYARYTKDGSKNYEKVTANILGINEDLYERYLNGELSKKYLEGDKLADEQLSEIVKQLANAKYTGTVNQYLILLENNPLNERGLGNLGMIVIIACAIIVVTSVFCIRNSFDISITEKIKQYGMLRSVGATKKQIRRNVFFEATILGLIGIPLGLILGAFASYLLVIVSNFFLVDMLTQGLKLVLSYSWVAMLVAVLLGFVTIYLSALKSAYKASKVSPIDSIRNSSDIKIKAKKIKSPKLIGKIFGVGGDISYKNLKRNKKKYKTTVISIVVSVSIFIALSYFMNATFSEVSRMIGANDYNIFLQYNVTRDEQYGYIEKITKLDSIKDYSVCRNIMLHLEEPKFSEEYLSLYDTDDIESLPANEKAYSVVAIGKEQYAKYLKELNLNYEDFKNKGIIVDSNEVQYLDDNGKAITKYIRKYMDDKNDIVSGKYDNDKDVRLDLSINIGLVTNQFPFGLTRDIPYIVVSDEFYNKLNIMPDKVFVYMDSFTPDKLQDEIEEILLNESCSISNIKENVKMMRQLYILVGIFLYGFILVISLIGITNIFNTITTSMNLRRQEFAMLKSIGMTSKEFNKMIRLESIFMGAKSLFFGVLIGVGLSYLEYKVLAETQGLPFDIPILSIIISIIVVYLLITILMKYSMKKISKQNTIETIRNENI